MLKKMLLVSCLGFTLLSTGNLSAPAVVYGAEVNDAEIICEAESTVILRAEQKEWLYRVVDGKLQKRLWSITWGKWLTEWEWV